MFKTLVKETRDIVEKTNLNLWIATCYLKLNKSTEAKKIIDKAILNVDSDQPEYMRALRLKADLHLEKYEFEPAMKIYLELIKKENDLYELSYLQNLIDDAEEKAYYYSNYGTLSEWKAKLGEKIKMILKQVNR